MLPVIALVGRPNVGKSTLFNRLTRTRDALAADVAGVTRDHLVGRGVIGPRPYLVIDTGGLGAGPPSLAAAIEAQALRVAAQADAIVLLTDARAGLVSEDARIAQQLRSFGRPLRLAVNKAEGLPEQAAAEFHALGLGAPQLISASHGDGIAELVQSVLATLPVTGPPPPAPGDAPPLIAVIGRPNVGKSTLVNRLCGQARVLVSPLPGTTRDRVRVPLRYAGRDYVLLDTPGVRRRRALGPGLEKLSVVKTLQSIEDADVVILLLDAAEGPTEQDARLAAYAAQHGRAVVVAVNKVDVITAARRRALAGELERALPFLAHAPRRYLSALTGAGVRGLLKQADTLHARAGAELPTAQLTRLLEDILRRNPPPLVQNYRPRLRYAHQGGRHPVTLVLHGTRIAGLPESYMRYLENAFRAALGLEGVPLRLTLRQAANPHVAGSTARRRTQGETRVRRARPRGDQKR